MDTEIPLQEWVRSLESKSSEKKKKENFLYSSEPYEPWKYTFPIRSKWLILISIPVIDCNHPQ